MTAAERLRREGRKAGARAYLITLLQTRFGALPEASLAAIQVAEKPQLDRWFERGLEAHTLDDVFGSVP
jgi:hypothetical protein